jgi:hypothetical protein
VKERAGKRPLLGGEMNITMRDGIAPIGDIEFTDNSSWIRSRKFRVAVKVSHYGSNQIVRIQEAMTEAFVVKDHRGECKFYHQLGIYYYYFVPKYKNSLNIARTSMYNLIMNIFNCLLVKIIKI